MAKNENELSPRDKIMKAIFGHKWKTDAELVAEIKTSSKVSVEEDKVFHSHMMLFVHAMKRNEELSEMVELIIARKFFPNENYRNVFKWSLMEAAQWQYEKLKNELPKWKKGTPQYKGWWLTKTIHEDGHVTIACETFQNDKWPYEGDDNVLYMDMNSLGKLSEEEEV